LGHRSWARIPVPADVLVAGDRPADKISWYVTEALPVLRASGQYHFHRTWYVVVAGKALAVAQGQARPLWDIQPRAVARVAAAVGGFDAVWTAHVVADTIGRFRTLVAAGLARLGWTGG